MVNLEIVTVVTVIFVVNLYLLLKVVRVFLKFMLCWGFVGRGVKCIVLPLVFSCSLLAILRDPGDREPSQPDHAQHCVDYDFIFSQSLWVFFCRVRREREMATAAPGASELSGLEENELLKEVCVVMDVIGFPLSSGFMIRELGFCSAIALRNASIGYFPLIGYAWMSEEDKKYSKSIYPQLL